MEDGEELYSQKEIFKLIHLKTSKRINYKDQFDFVSTKFSSSWFIKKLIMEYFILTQWTDWMEVVTKVEKFRVCLQNPNSRTSFFQPGENDTDQSHSYSRFYKTCTEIPFSDEKWPNDFLANSTV